MFDGEIVVIPATEVNRIESYVVTFFGLHEKINIEQPLCFEFVSD